MKQDCHWGFGNVNSDNWRDFLANPSKDSDSGDDSSSSRSSGPLSWVKLPSLSRKSEPQPPPAAPFAPEDADAAFMPASSTPPAPQQYRSTTSRTTRVPVAAQPARAVPPSLSSPPPSPAAAAARAPSPRPSLPCPAPKGPPRPPPSSRPAPLSAAPNALPDQPSPPARRSLFGSRPSLPLSSPGRSAGYDNPVFEASHQEAEVESSEPSFSLSGCSSLSNPLYESDSDHSRQPSYSLCFTFPTTPVHASSPSSLQGAAETSAHQPMPLQQQGSAVADLSDRQCSGVWSSSDDTSFNPHTASALTVQRYMQRRVSSPQLLPASTTDGPDSSLSRRSWSISDAGQSGRESSKPALVTKPCIHIYIDALYVEPDSVADSSQAIHVAPAGAGPLAPAATGSSAVPEEEWGEWVGAPAVSSSGVAGGEASRSRVRAPAAADKELSAWHPPCSQEGGSQCSLPGVGASACAAALDPKPQQAPLRQGAAPQAPQASQASGAASPAGAAQGSEPQACQGRAMRVVKAWGNKFMAVFKALAHT